jgi:hypothetical protein
MLTINKKVYKDSSDIVIFTHPTCMRWDVSGRHCWIRYATPHQTFHLILYHNEKLSFFLPRETILLMFFPKYEDENLWNKYYRPSPLTLTFLSSIVIAEHDIETPQPLKKFITAVELEHIDPEWTVYSNPETESEDDSEDDYFL